MIRLFFPLKNFFLKKRRVNRISCVEIFLKKKKKKKKRGDFSLEASRQTLKQNRHCFPKKKGYEGCRPFLKWV